MYWQRWANTDVHRPTMSEIEDNKEAKTRRQLVQRSGQGSIGANDQGQQERVNKLIAGLSLVSRDILRLQATSKSMFKIEDQVAHDSNELMLGLSMPLPLQLMSDYSIIIE